MNSLKLGLAALALSTLGGCAMHQRHHPGGMAGPGAGMGMGMGTMDMNARCESHRQMMAGKTPAERRAFMDSQMPSMTPEMRQQMQENEQRCQ